MPNNATIVAVNILAIFLLCYVMLIWLDGCKLVSYVKTCRTLNDGGQTGGVLTHGYMAVSASAEGDDNVLYWEKLFEFLNLSWDAWMPSQTEQSRGAFGAR